MTVPSDKIEKERFYEKCNETMEAWVSYFNKPRTFGNEDLIINIAGVDLACGDELFAVPAKGKIGVIQHKVIKGFNPIYGSHHKFYGAMDFFYVSTYVNGFTPGLQNTYFGASYKPFKGLSLQASYHYLAMATQLIDIEKTLGHELEIQGSCKFTKDISLSAGFSYMTGTKNMEKLRRASSDGRLRWGRISLNISPRLFTTKW
jgi:hypothetical protein